MIGHPAPLAMAVAERRPGALPRGLVLLLCITSSAALGIQHGAESSEALRHRAESSEGLRYRAESTLGVGLGMMAESGVTHYRSTATAGVARYGKRIKKVKSTGTFYNSGWESSRMNSRFEGPKELSDSVSWGWHHPNGFYNTIPVGAPLIDDDMNIYVGSDDAIRKFDPVGNLEWSYAPRGQLASAPGLIKAARLTFTAREHGQDEQGNAHPETIAVPAGYSVAAAWYGDENRSQGADVTDVVRQAIADGNTTIWACDDVLGDPLLSIMKWLFIDFVQAEPQRRLEASIAPAADGHHSAAEVEAMLQPAGRLQACVDDSAGLMEAGKSIGETVSGCSESASMCKHPKYGQTVRALCCFSCAAAALDEQIEGGDGGETEETDAPPGFAASLVSQEGALQMGDHLKVRDGNAYREHSTEFFEAGDEGVVSNVFTADGEERAMIHWLRTNKQSSSSRKNWAWRYIRTKSSYHTDTGIALGLKQRASQKLKLHREATNAVDGALEAKARARPAEWQDTGAEGDRSQEDAGAESGEGAGSGDGAESGEGAAAAAGTRSSWWPGPRSGTIPGWSVDAIMEHVDVTPGSPPVQSALVGSTTNGFVFAIDLATGSELWAMQVSTAIAGVKGSVAGENYIVLAATDRCTDRYCYRYRNETNNLEPGNSVVRGLNAHSGESVWDFRPESPVWNFVPLFGANSTVMFQDYEASVYCLDWRTGALKWKTEGTMGTVSQASATYDPDLNIVYSLGVKKLESEWCSPATPPGVLIQCSPNSYTAGVLRAFNAANGHKLWELDLPHVPAGATVGKIVGYGHYAVVVGMGVNCKYASSSALLAADAQTGTVIFERSGPTLWSDECAGDKAGGDIRRAVGMRAACTPNSWSDPVIDKDGSIYIGSQVGQLQKWGLPNDTSVASDMQTVSTLSTFVALPDHSIAMAPGMMAISTCTSLIVLQVD